MAGGKVLLLNNITLTNRKNSREHPRQQNDGKQPPIPLETRPLMRLFAKLALAEIFIIEVFIR